MAKTTKSPIALRTRSKKTTVITKKMNNFNITVNLVRLTQIQIAEAMANNLIEPPKYNLRNRIQKEEQPQKKQRRRRKNHPPQIQFAIKMK